MPDSAGAKAKGAGATFMARLQPTAVAETPSWFYFNESD
jgi:hypothetical protein